MKVVFSEVVSEVMVDLLRTRGLPLIVTGSLCIHHHLQPDLLDDAHQQGVHVVVQGSTHLYILAVMGGGQ